MTSPIPFEQYDSIGRVQRAEIDRLREQCAFKGVELHVRDRVIARLLDGWEPMAGKPLMWWGPPKRGGSRPLEPMSDGEAAVIRAHQERS